ncbi:MAG: hypothetical protein Q4A60_06240 [Pasteurellaceae bacterium]|nr:hypothetical protein [Pasteurellaceae bacterium]
MSGGDDGLTKPLNKKGEPVGKGIAHIIEARMRKDGMSYQDATRMLTNEIVETIAKGQIQNHWIRNDGKSESVQIDYNGYRAGLVRNAGSNGWLLTAFKLYPTDVNSAGSVDTEKTTHIKPTLTRQDVGAIGEPTLPQTEAQINPLEGAKYSRSAQETPSFYETEQRLGGKEAYESAVRNGETELDYRQWVQVRTPEFKAWFGDWENDPDNASKVINPKTGEPLVAYHNTDSEFNTFDLSEARAHSDVQGFYFSPDKYSWEDAGENQKSVFLNIKTPTPNGKPLVDRSQNYAGVKVRDEMLSQGYDGSIEVEDEIVGEFLTLNPNQIKSATDNHGNFDSNQADIRFSKALQKPDRLEKLRQAKPIEISGNEIPHSDDFKQYRKNILKYGLERIKGEYVNKDTGRSIKVVRGSINELMHHDMSSEAHIQSITAVPKIIEEGIYIDTLPNEDRAKNPDIKEYEYYVAGLKIDGEDYTVKSAIGVSTTGHKYYDHKLTKIEKGNLLEMTSRLSNAEISNASPLSDLNDKRLLQILQQQNAKLEQTHTQIKQIVGGKLAEHFNVVSREQLGITDPTIEAGYNLKTGKIFIVEENIRDNGILSRDERLKWVAWHELAHRGVQVKFAHQYRNLITKIEQNTTVRELADAIQQQREETANNRLLAVEEALAELNAAYSTGKMDELKARYGITIPLGREKSLRAWFEMTAERIREFVARIFGKERAEQFSQNDLINLIKDIQSGMDGEIRSFSVEGEVKQSADEKTKIRSFNATAEQYGGKPAYEQARAEGKTELDYRQWVQVRTPEFKAWFGDWENDPDNASKVINPKTGEPLVVYHGTAYGGFTTFRTSSFESEGAFFSEKSGVAASYAGSRKKIKLGEKSFDKNGRYKGDEQVSYPVFLNIRQPEKFDFKGREWTDYDKNWHVYNVDGEIIRSFYSPQEANDYSTMLYHNKGITSYIERDKNPKNTDSLSKAVKELGINDGVRFLNVIDSADPMFYKSKANNWVVFNPNQIKSATDNTGAFDVGNDDIRYSLNEDPNSSFAKAVETVAQGGKPSQQYIPMGSTPMVLKMLGIADTKVLINRDVLNKVMGDKHNVTAETLKQLPSQLNNPVAVMKSAPQATQQGYVVLTELIEENAITGQQEPVISALHLKTAKDGIEVINIASVYGKNLRGLQNMLNHDLLYWHKEKGSQFIDAFGLQLPSKIASKNVSQSASNIKTETDLSQYQNSQIKFSRTQTNVEKLRKINENTPLEKLGDVASELANRPLSEWKALMLEYGKRANSKIFDALAPIKYAEDKAGITDHTQSAYTAARLAAGSASISEATMLYGLPEYRDGIIQRKQGTGEQDALFGILQSLGNDANDFLAWVAGNRADKLMKEGRENHFSQAEIDELKALNKGKEAKFEQARQKLMAFNTALLDLAENAGVINKDDRAKWEDKDFYIPFYREAEDGDAIAPYRNKGLSGQNSGIKRLKGSDKAVNDLLENIVMNATKLIDASVKNAAMTKAVTNLADTGVITLIDNPTYMDWKKLGSNKHGADKDGGVAMVRIEGKEQLVRINDAMLFNAITSIDQQPLDYPLRKLFAGAKRVLTATVTSMPNFIVRNFLRDMAQAWVVDRNNGFKLGVDSLKGLKDAYKRSGSAIDLMFAGASFGAGYVNGGNPQEAAVHIRKHLRKQGKSAAEIDGFMDGVIYSKDQLSKVLDQYFRVAQAAENANRIAVYDRAIASGKSKAQAALESKDLMDFSMHGSAKALRLLADVLPFFNARLQGMSQLGRAFKENPRELAKRGAMIALASVALSAMNEGEDWYEEQSDEIKDNFWLANLGGQIVKIPKPFELGVVFGTVPERLYRTMSGADSTGRFKERLLSAISNTLALNPIPQAVKPIFEVYNNYDSFRGREIENMSDRRLIKQERYDNNTSLVARELGNVSAMFGLSPKQVDHLVNGYFGTLGMYVLGITDMGIRSNGNYGENPAKNWQEYPVFNAIFGGDVNVPRKYTKQMNDFYRYLNHVSEIAATVKSYQNDGLIEKSRSLFEENHRLLAYRPQLNAVQKEVRQIRAQMEIIQNNRHLDAEQKRERIDRLLSRRNALVSRIVERMREEDF